MFFRSLTSPYALLAAEGRRGGNGSAGDAGGAGDDDDDDDEARMAAASDDDDADHDHEEMTPERVAQLMREADAARRELAAVKKNRDKILQERRRFSESLKKYNRFGDPEELEEKLREREEAEEQDAKKTGDTEKLLAQRDEKYKRDIGAKEEAISTLNQRIERLTVNQRLRAALNEVKVDSDLMDGAFALLRPRMKLVEDDDDEDGYRVVATVDDDEMPIDDYVKSLAETDPKFQRYLVLPVNSGGGAQAGNRRGGDVIARKPRSKMTLPEKTAFVQKYGQEKYLQLPD